MFSSREKKVVCILSFTKFVAFQARGSTGITKALSEKDTSEV